MGVRTTSGENVVALFDSVSGFAFGPTFDTDEDADDFLSYTSGGPDLRTLSDEELDRLHSKWLKTREDGHQ